MRMSQSFMYEKGARTDEIRRAPCHPILPYYPLRGFWKGGLALDINKIVPDPEAKFFAHS